MSGKLRCFGKSITEVRQAVLFVVKVLLCTRRCIHTCTYTAVDVYLHVCVVWFLVCMQTREHQAKRKAKQGVDGKALAFDLYAHPHVAFIIP